MTTNPTKWAEQHLYDLMNAAAFAVTILDKFLADEEITEDTLVTAAMEFGLLHYDNPTAEEIASGQFTDIDVAVDRTKMYGRITDMLGDAAEASQSDTEDADDVVEVDLVSAKH